MKLSNRCYVAALSFILLVFVVLGLGSILNARSADAFAEALASPTPAAPDGPFVAEPIFTAASPIVALAVGSDGSLYVLTYDGEVLRVSPDGTSMSLATGLSSCSFSSYALVVLPDGSVIANSCADEKDILIKIDPAGNQSTLAQLESNVLSMASDVSGNVYVGTWSSEGDLTVMFDPSTYLAAAVNMWGQVSLVDSTGALTTVYTGGPPLALHASENGDLYAAVWGQSGGFSSESKSYSVCDLRNFFWITLSEQVQIQQILNGQALPVTDQLDAVGSLASANGLLLAYGYPSDQVCGVYQIEENQLQRLSFTEDEVDELLTGMVTSGNTLYFSDVDGNVYRVNLETLGGGEENVASGAGETASSTTNLTPTPIPTVAPAVGNPGPIAFVSDRRGWTEIYVMNTDGSQVYRLTDNTAFELDPVWSPDGTQIAFVSNRDGNDEIYVMNADGSQVRRLTYSTVSNWDPAWSPDGTQIAFLSDLDEIFVVNVDGSNLRQLTDNPAFDGSFSWSPDGTQIAFLSNRDGNYEIYVMDADGSNVRQLTGGVDVSIPVWSPDGGQIVFRTSSDIYIMNADGSNMRQLIDTADYTDPGFVRNLSWSPDGTQITFVSDRDGNQEVYVVNADGSDVRRLTNDNATDWMPAWSPDGTQITFVSDRDGDEEIYVMDADGNNVRQLTENDDDDHWQAWSPDGQWIVFSSNRDKQRDIYVMDEEGSSVQALTDDFAWEWSPVWSFDGQQLAFISDRDGNFELYVMNADGSNVRRLTETPGEEWSPAWSPDGTQIAFNSNRDGNYEIYAVTVDGSSVRRLTNNTVNDGEPAWSPDGRTIAFISERDGNWEIYTMDISGNNVRRLTNDDAEDRGPAWSPDGRRIAFNSFRDGNWEIYVMNADGGTVRRLTDNLFEDRSPVWSPDGNQIVFASNRSLNWDIYVINADGSGEHTLTNSIADDVLPSWSWKTASAVSPTLSAPTPTPEATPQVQAYPSVNLPNTYTTPDGTLTFRYPGGWEVSGDSSNGYVMGSDTCSFMLFTPSTFILTPEAVRQANLKSAGDILQSSFFLQLGNNLNAPVDITWGSYSGVIADGTNASGAAFVAVLSLGGDQYLALMSVSISSGRLEECKTTIQAILSTAQYASSTVLSETYTTASGMTVNYPAGWVPQEDSYSVLLANSQEAMDALNNAGSLVPGAFYIAIFNPSATPVFAGEARTLPDILAAMLQQMSQGAGLTIGGITNTTIGDHSAAQVYFTGLAGEGTAYAIDYGSNQIVYVNAIAVKGELSNFEPVVKSILEGVHLEENNTVSPAVSIEDQLAASQPITVANAGQITSPVVLERFWEDFAWSPTDSNTLATLEISGGAVLVHLPDVTYQELPVPIVAMDHITFSPDGVTLALDDVFNDTIVLWNTVTGESRSIPTGVSQSLNSLTFNSDGTLLAAGTGISKNLSVLVWDVATGKKLATLTGPESTPEDVTFSPDGKIIAAIVSGIDEIWLWDVATGENLYVLNPGYGGQIAFSPDGTLLASTSQTGSVSLWDVASGTRRKTLYGHTDAVISIAFSPDGTLLVSSGIDGTIRFWDVATGASLAVLDSQSDFADHLAFNADGTLLASLGGDDDHKIRLWSVSGTAAAPTNTQQLPPASCVVTLSNPIPVFSEPSESSYSGETAEGNVESDGQFTDQDGLLWYRLTNGKWAMSDFLFLESGVPSECTGLPEVTP